MWIFLIVIIIFGFIVLFKNEMKQICKPSKKRQIKQHNYERVERSKDINSSTSNISSEKNKFDTHCSTVKTLKTFKPSKYQSAIFDWISNGKGNAVVEAVAGSGKTTTLVEASNIISSDSALFLAFNKHIATELNNRLNKMRSQTIHSLGYESVRSIGNPKVDAYKYSNLIKLYVNKNQGTNKDKEQIERLKNLISLTQLTLTNPKSELDLLTMSNHFDLEIGEREDWDFLWRAIEPILKEGIELSNTVIDFNDMVWLPWVLNLKPKSYEWLFIDEAQDLNRAQLELLLKCQDANGRLVFVGDRRQAIYGFAGADSQSIQNIINRTNAEVLPLSICYRCPQSHIELASDIFPGIEPAPDAIEGTVEKINEDNIGQIVQSGDLIICRTTAPLIKVCLTLIRLGITAKVRGRDIGKQLISTLQQIAKYPNFKFHSLINFILLWQDKQIRELSKQDNTELAIESINDRASTLIVLVESLYAKSLKELESEIANIFCDSRPSVWLSTVHRSKGLEAERVFILYPDKMPHPSAKKDWQIEQEMNLKYVSYTRAKKDLFLVSN